MQYVTFVVPIGSSLKVEAVFGSEAVNRTFSMLDVVCFV